MATTTLEHYRERCRGTGVFTENRVPAPMPAQSYSTYRVDPTLGGGWMDLLQVGSDLTVGRAAYALNGPFRQPLAHGSGSVGIFVLLSGSVRFTTGRRTETLHGGSVWVRDGRHMGSDVLYELPVRQSQVAVSLDVPVSWLDARADAVPGAGSGRAGPSGLFSRLAGEGAHHCLAAAGSLLALRPDSVVSRLRMESAALDLAAALLGLAAGPQGPRLPRRHRAAVDDAIDILGLELDTDHTIASLARRVGINECSLKAAFRQGTGTTIAAFLRERRMHHARALIEREGQGVQQAALSVGYANPSHFAAAFRKVHGLAPSSLR
jgi:AraC-like DNA-binding protein